MRCGVGWSRWELNRHPPHPAAISHSITPTYRDLTRRLKGAPDGQHDGCRLKWRPPRDTLPMALITEALVADLAARDGGQDRRQGRHPRTIRRLPDGRAGAATRDVPPHPEDDRRIFDLDRQPDVESCRSPLCRGWHRRETRGPGVRPDQNRRASSAPASRFGCLQTARIKPNLPVGRQISPASWKMPVEGRE